MPKPTIVRVQEMSERRGHHFTMHLVGDATGDFLSCTVFPGSPTLKQVELCDWLSFVGRGNVHVYVVGRGDEPTRSTLSTLAASWLRGDEKWVRVNLDTLETSPAATERENDPLWDRIRRAANGGAS